ncbi:MAG: GIY-YIG nuclease family protein [Clostridiales bacterium]|nr:GIY-YIG nuclease family protein [Clostridiales bacterium]
MNKTKGFIYILTNPSFKEWVKIGYADNVEERVAQLNRTECTPFAFSVYATYEVSDRLKDISVHSLIDKLNPSLRSKDEIDGKVRIREFYAMSPEEAYEILEMIAKINGLESNLKLWKKTKEEVEDEKTAQVIENLSKNRHHFKDIVFTSSLTNKKYKGTTNDNGTLMIVDVETNCEVPNNSKPSKKAIIGQAIKDLGGDTTKDETLYQRYHKLSRMILG